MKLLPALKKMISRDPATAVLEYVLANDWAIAAELGIPQVRLMVGIIRPESDERIVTMLAEDIRLLEREARAKRADGKASSAQQVADAVAAGAERREGRVLLDVKALFAGALLTGQRAQLVVEGQDQRAYPMRVLTGLPASKRGAISGWLDGQGLHVRWATGGMDLLPWPVDQEAPRVTLRLQGVA